MMRAGGDSARQFVHIPPFDLEGILGIPQENVRGLVIFAHGSGSSRVSPRNTMVAGALQRAGIATLLFDLLTERESTDRRNVFDIALLAERLRGATDWAREYPATRNLSIGYFGASTGAAAALVAAARTASDVAAIVSRGGRPDLAGEALPRVAAPTLLIVGGEDTEVLALNREAAARMRCEKKIEVVRGATHLFEEPGTLEQVIVLAERWFKDHLASPPGAQAA
jgi:putative phosphoribosyl transferase